MPSPERVEQAEGHGEKAALVGAVVKARHNCFWILGSHRFPVGTDKGPFLIVF